MSKGFQNSDKSYKVLELNLNLGYYGNICIVVGLHDIEKMWQWKQWGKNP